MAYIGHLCGCGHTDVHHTRKADGKQGACAINAGRSCGNGCRRNAKPILRPTYNLKRQEVERIVPPGERYGSEAGGVPTCDCDACKALYAELTAQAA